MSFRIPVENELIEHIFQHLGPDAVGDSFDPNYSNKMIARKFFHFYSKGSDKFKYSQSKKEAQILVEMLKQINALNDNFADLELITRNRLDQMHPTTFDFRTEADEVSNAKHDRPLDIDVADFQYRGFLAHLGVMSEAIESVLNEIPTELKAIKVNWRACAAAHLARVVWKQRTGRTAPKSVHADAQGKFGDFLGEILDELARLIPYDGEAVSARSALRALENITSKGVIPHGNW